MPLCLPWAMGSQHWTGSFMAVQWRGLVLFSLTPYISVSSDPAKPLKIRNSLPALDTCCFSFECCADFAHFKMVCDDSEQLPLAFCFFLPFKGALHCSLCLSLPCHYPGFSVFQLLLHGKSAPKFSGFSLQSLLLLTTCELQGVLWCSSSRLGLFGHGLLVCLGLSWNS